MVTLATGENSVRDPGCIYKVHIWQSCFRLRREPEQLSDIISYFQAFDGKATIIFDDLTKFPNLGRKLIDLRKNNITILATVRSNVLETSRSLIEARLGSSTFTEIDLNLASQDEIKSISAYLDENGLWGSLAELNEFEKNEFIKRKCGGQFRDVMLTLFDEGALHERVSELIDSIRDLSPSIFRLLILSALLTIAGH